MKFALLFMFLGLTTLADTYQYKIEGMSCSACKNMVKASVCALPGIKSCEVEIGSMKLTATDGQTLDQAAITNALDELNKKNKEDYKIASSTKVADVAMPTTAAPEKAATKTSATKDSNKVKK